MNDVKEKSDQVIYTSRNFKVMRDKVVQGEFEAVALSPTELTSNYKSSANDSFSPEVTFKFSINGKDNEMPTGHNHFIVVKPQNGHFTSHVIKFGQQHTDTHGESSLFLEPDTKVTLRLDMSKVLESFSKKGFYTLYNGDKLYKDDFKGIYVAGNKEPLTWDFDNLQIRPDLQLHDEDGDGIYTVTFNLNAHNPDNFTSTHWKQESDLDVFPAYTSGHVLIDALYNLSLEELQKNIRPDFSFMAGEKWEGVWTRDISYSIILSLAFIHPEICKNSLLKKVKNGKIVQDTGTGGSWPVSSDRMTWALAAWEIYKVTGDEEWMKEAFQIIKKTSEQDLLTVYDKESGLFLGESSFLDWREQSYAGWMDPVDIYTSRCLATNSIHYQTYVILSEMARILGEDSSSYSKIATRIKDGVNNHLWIESRNYYGQYLYGETFLSLSEKAETLGEAFCILFDIADNERQQKILENTPVTEFGVPCIFPQIPDVPPYHNDGVWPFVQAFWAMAAAKTGNEKSLDHSLGSIFRSLALFLTNKENFSASNGDFRATVVNSDRQLWSVAGNLAIIYKIFFGIECCKDGIHFRPFVPKAYKGDKELANFKYRNATFDLKLQGYGNQIRRITLDDKDLQKAFIPADISGEHEIAIVLADNELEGFINLTENEFAPAAPEVELKGTSIVWKQVAGATEYEIRKNGRLFKNTNELSEKLELSSDYEEYQVLAINSKAYKSFLSEPVKLIPSSKYKVVGLESLVPKSKLPYKGYTGKGFIEISQCINTSIDLLVIVSKDSPYFLDFRYSNGSGPENTDNKCAIRSLYVNGVRAATIVMPQIGKDEWSVWAYSNTVVVNLKQGENLLKLQLDPSDENMDGEINTAMLDHLRLIRK